MKERTKTAAISALKWATFLTIAFVVVGPAMVIFGKGTHDPGGLIAEKLLIGIARFPIIFFGLWVWGYFFKKSPSPSDGTHFDNYERRSRPITTCRSCGEGFRMLASTNEFHPICWKCLVCPPAASQNDKGDEKSNLYNVDNIDEMFFACRSESEIVSLCGQVLTGLGFRLTGSNGKWTVHSTEGIGKVYLYSLVDLKKQVKKYINDAERKESL